MRKIGFLFLTLTLVLSLSLTVFATGSEFSDVSEQHWANEFVEKAAQNGWIAGVGEGKFNPDARVTGAEWYTMVTSTFFADKIPDQVPAGQWYSGKWYAQFMAADEQLALAERLDDYATSQDIAERPLTRAEMAAVIFKVLEWYDVQAPEDKLTEVEQSIPDLSNYDMVDGRYGPIIKCYALGILAGTDSKGTFNGEADMTRAQAAVTLCRLADVIEAKENGTLPGSDDKPDPKPEPEPEPDPGDQPTAKVPTEAEAYDILMQIKAEYPHGTPWGNDKTYHSPNYGTATFSGCAAFTQMCQDRIFGNFNENGLSMRRHTDFDAIKVGDIISEDDTGVHKVVVVEKKADSVIIAEGNFSSEVRWGREITRSELESNNYGVRTLYPN